MRLFRKKRKKKLGFWDKTKMLCRILIVTLAILKMFEVHSFVMIKFKESPAFKRHCFLVAQDGYWYRATTWFKNFGKS